MTKARELAELSRTVSDSADAVAITIDSSENVTFSNDITVTGNTTTAGLTVDTNTLVVDATNNRVGFNDTTPSVSVDAGSNTDAIAIPVGTTAERPTGAAGRFRYNSTLSQFEGYTNSWGAIGGASGFETNNFTGDGSTTAFTLSSAPSSSGDVIVFVEGVYQTPTDFTLSGTTLTLDAAPPSGRKIVVYHVSAVVSTNVSVANNSIGVTQLNLNDGTSGQVLTTDGSGAISFADVSAANNSIGVAQLNLTDGTSGQVLTTDGSGTISFATVSGGGGGGSTAGISSSANATAMTITIDEEIGIGLTNPEDFTGSANNLVVGGSGSNGMTLVMGQNNGDRAQLDFRSNVYPGGSFSNIISSIAVTSPHSSAPYDEMIFTVSSQEFMRFGKGNSSVGTYMLFGKTSYSNTTDGVQTSKGYEWVWTCPSSAYPISLNDGSGWKFEVRGTGQIKSVYTSISSISDERVKENIVDLETGLSQIMALKPRRFDFKDGEGSGEKSVAGFVAQEVESVLPDLIDFSRHDTIEDLKSLKMGDMIPTMVKAMQEQQAVIESLTNRIAALEQ